MTDSRMASYLAEHPRLIGALFMLTVLLTQIGGVAAGNSHTVSGP